MADSINTLSTQYAAQGGATGSLTYELPFFYLWASFYGTDESQLQPFLNSVTAFAGQTYVDPESGVEDNFAASAAEYTDATWQKRYLTYVASLSGSSTTIDHDEISLQAMLQYEYLVGMNFDLTDRLEAYALAVDATTTIVNNLNFIVDKYFQRETPTKDDIEDSDGDTEDVDLAIRDGNEGTLANSDWAAVNSAAQAIIDTLAELETVNFGDSEVASTLTTLKTILADVTTQATKTISSGQITLSSINGSGWILDEDVGADLRAALVGASNVNQIVQANITKSITIFEGFYNSATNMVAAVHQIIKSMGSHIER